jgi:hypothetical protein
MRKKIDRPTDIARLQPAAHKIVTTVIDKDLCDEQLVRLGGGSGERKRDLAKAKFE